MRGRVESHFSTGLEPKRMISGPALVLLLLLAPYIGRTDSSPCRCSAPHPEGLRVHCGLRHLAELPGLPPETTELYLQDNELSGVPPGSFDRLQGLRTLNLTGNRFHCGCAIRYLSAWLRDHRGVAVQEPTCASPPGLAGRPIAGLSQAHFSSCGRKQRAGCGLEVFTLLALVVLVFLFLWCIKTAKGSTFILEVFATHRDFEAHTLRSRKPKHRRKRHSVQAEDSKMILEDTDDGNLEALNMEILPQILDVLQQKHNMKFKAP